MPRFNTGAASCARESEWETFRRLITHDDRNSYYVVSSLANGTWEDVAVRKGNLAVLGFSDAASYYMTHNGFFEPNRKSESTRQINALFFDLDCHNRALGETRAVVDRTLELLQQACSAKELPTPTMIIDSGRGVQLFYVLRRSIPTYSNKTMNSKSISLFESVQRRMTDVLDHLLSPIDGISVDRATGDLSRVSRIPGTYNHAAGCAARLVDASEEMHSLSELSAFASEYLITNVAARPTRAPKKTRATMLQYAPLMMSRLGKVIELQAHRHFRCEGNRELMCFVFYNTAVQIYERVDARDRLHAFNDRFTCPLAASELAGIERSVDKVINYQGQTGFYLIGAERLAELLGLTEEENEAIHFFESKRAILRAQAKRDTARKRRERNNEILRLRRTTNLTQYAIANEVGVSLRTVASVLNRKAAQERASKLQRLTRPHGKRLQLLVQKYNKKLSNTYNNKQGETCNSLSYVFLKCSPSLLGAFLTHGASGFAYGWLRPPQSLVCAAKDPVTRNLASRVSVTGSQESFFSVASRAFSLSPSRAP